MTTVFILHHEYEWCGHDETKLIGVYVTRAEAEAAASRLRDQPGFRNWPEGFSVDAYQLGVDHWVEGFVTLVNILVPSKGTAEGHQVAESAWLRGDLYEICKLDEPKRAQFALGDVVRCAERSIPEFGDSVLVAIEAVGKAK